MRRVSLNYYYLTEINILNTVAVVQSLSCVWLCDLMDCSTPGSSVLHYYLSMSTESVMLSNRLILCHSLSFCLQSFRASVSFPMSRLFTSGGQRIGASASVLPVNIQGCFPLGLTGLISLLLPLIISDPLFLFWDHCDAFLTQLWGCTGLGQQARAK